MLLQAGGLGAARDAASGRLTGTTLGSPVNRTDAYGLAGISTECAFAVASLLFSVGGDAFFTFKLLKGFPTMARFIWMSLKGISRTSLVFVDGVLVPMVRKAADFRNSADAMDALEGELAKDLVIWTSYDVVGEAFGAAAEVSAGRLPSLRDFLLGLIPWVGTSLALDAALSACSELSECQGSGP